MGSGNLKPSALVLLFELPLVWYFKKTQLYDISYTEHEHYDHLQCAVMCLWFAYKWRV